MDAEPNAILVEKSWWQWSLMEVLTATGVVAVFIAIAAYLGFGNGLLVAFTCQIRTVSPPTSNADN